MWTRGQGGGSLSGSLSILRSSWKTLASAHPQVSLVSPPTPQAPGLASASKHRASWKEAKPRKPGWAVPCSRALPGYWEDPEDEEKFRRAADPRA